MRQYYDYIAPFDPKEAKVRIECLEDDMGYMTKIVYAAGLVAKDLHKGQHEKGGNDYFESPKEVLFEQIANFAIAG